MTTRSSMLLVLLAVANGAAAQAPAPAQPAPAPAPARMATDTNPSRQDPRVCLEFPTREQVIACAERFRPRRAAAKTAG
ncbi:MAG: hypothetical protein IT518_22690 [Burkholderiales bacterium]|nr:hypothetical protein [Burkholderiales bacterium]